MPVGSAGFMVCGSSAGADDERARPKSGKLLESIGMSVCRRCGSLRTRVVAGSLFDRALRVLFRRHVVVCGRCGFRGRQGRGEVLQVRTGEPTIPQHAGIDLAELDRALDVERRSRAGGA
jgi:hypothetical protein